MSLYTLSVYVVQTVAVLVVLIAMCACYLLMLHVADGEREPHPEELVLRQAIRDAKTDPDGLERSIRAARKAGVDETLVWSACTALVHAWRCNDSATFAPAAAATAAPVQDTPPGTSLRREHSLYAGEEIPERWEQAWLGERAGSACRTNRGDSCRGDLPVRVFMSSMAGDRKALRDSRWVLDFLRYKRVPFEVIDLAAQPEERQRMARLTGDEDPPLPQVQVGEQSLSVDRLCDLEDHAELDPLLRVVVRRYAGAASRPERARTLSPSSTGACRSSHAVGKEKAA